MAAAGRVLNWCSSLYASDGVGGEIKKLEDFYSFRLSSASSHEGVNVAKRYYFGFSAPEEGSNTLLSYQSEDMHAYEMTNKAHKQKLKTIVDEEKESVDEDAGLDWEMISEKLAKFCRRKYLPIECFIQYRNNLDPSIEKGKWSAEEEARLITLAESYGEHDWVSIAEELSGSRRTPIECLCHYQQAFNTKLFTMNHWNAEEENLLKEAAKCQEGNGKNWKVIASKVPGRTSYQCYIKWRRTASMREDTEKVDGKWEADDERRLYLAVIAYKILCLDDQKMPGSDRRTFVDENLLGGSSSSSPAIYLPATSALTKSNGRWIDVAHHIKRKNDARCRDKWTTSLDNSISNEPWSEYEDSILLALVEKFGPGKWSSYSVWLPGRTDACLLSRWSRLSNKPARDARGGALKKRKAVMPPMLNRKDKSGSMLNEGNFARQVRIKREN